MSQILDVCSKYVRYIFMYYLNGYDYSVFKMFPKSAGTRHVSGIDTECYRSCRAS